MDTDKGFSLHPFAFPRKSSIRLSHSSLSIWLHLWFEKEFPKVLSIRFLIVLLCLLVVQA
jgi:hypothetical protein